MPGGDELPGMSPRFRTVPRLAAGTAFYAAPRSVRNAADMR